MSDTLDGAGPGVGFDFSVMAEVAARLGQAADALDRERSALERARQSVSDRIPISAKGAAVASANANGLAVIDLRGPAQGRKWELRACRVGGAQASATPAGTGYLFGSAANPDTAQSADLSLVNLIDTITEALPQVAFYSADQAVIEYPERLWVVIVGGTSGVQYVANFLALDYPIILGARTVVTL